VRDIDYISVKNNDTVPATVTIQYNDNATIYKITTITMQVGDTLSYTHSAGWQTISQNSSLDAIRQTFVGGVGFTAGTSTTLTLAVAPATANSLMVFFDGALQQHTEWTLSNSTITFSSAIPSGVLQVECVYVQPATLSVPGTGTVTTASLGTSGIALPDGSSAVNFTVGGNLVVSGTTVTVNTENATAFNATSIGATTPGSGSFTTLFSSQGTNITGAGAQNIASSLGLDNNVGTSRLYSHGPNTTTGGTFEFHSSSSNGSVDNVRMSLDATGSLTVANGLSVAGTITGAGIAPYAKISVPNFTGNIDTDYVGIVKNSATVTAGVNKMLAFFSSGGVVPQGFIASNSTSAAAFFAGSDRRIKENITPMSGALDKVVGLNPCTFNFKQDGNKSEGFIAQELNQTFPQLVYRTDDGLGDTVPEGTEYWSVNTQGLIPFLVSAIKDQQAQIEALTSRIAVLETK
jgi:hypothetical protein